MTHSDKSMTIDDAAEARKARKREYARAWRAANPEKERERYRAWRAANPEKERERDRARRAANPEKERERDRARRAANPEKERERYRAWRAANPEKERERDRARRAANPEKARAIWLTSKRARRARDPVSFARKQMLRNSRRNAKTRNLPFNLTIDDIVMPTTCPVLGIELDLSNQKTTDNSPSLDRIVPELGYVQGNVMVISWKANRIKNDATPHELRLVADFYAALDVNSNDTKENSNDTEN